METAISYKSSITICFIKICFNLALLSFLWSVFKKHILMEFLEILWTKTVEWSLRWSMWEGRPLNWFHKLNGRQNDLLGLRSYKCGVLASKLIFKNTKLLIHWQMYWRKVKYQCWLTVMINKVWSWLNFHKPKIQHLLEQSSKIMNTPVESFSSQKD